jgi:hypothetical protein
MVSVFKSVALALVAAISISCSGGQAPTIPAIELPSIDTAALQTLVDNALAEVGNLTENPPQIDLPPELATLLAEHQIQLPPLPTNAQEICDAMGFPGSSTLTGAGLGAVIDGLSGLEVGLVVGLLVTVVFRTCPIWSPHLERAIEDLL